MALSDETAAVVAADIATALFGFDTYSKTGDPTIFFLAFNLLKNTMGNFPVEDREVAIKTVSKEFKESYEVAHLEHIFRES